MVACIAPVIASDACFSSARSGGRLHRAQAFQQPGRVDRGAFGKAASSTLALFIGRKDGSIPIRGEAGPWSFK
jgi:hypothetical protein